jgi:hypothetical protein
MNRVAATVAVWLVAAGLGGLVWLGAQEPFIGLPATHPINLILFGVCLAIGLGFTVALWLPGRRKRDGNKEGESSPGTTHRLS